MDSPAKTGQTNTVLVELNPAALLLETRLESLQVEGERHESLQVEGEGERLEENDSPERELSEEMESDDFNAENIKSKWLDM